MGSAKICMNEVCRVTTTSEWKKGWGLKSGGFATLCCNCGSAYENFVFCETFHLDESGWRECKLCGKRIHCGCIASKYLHNYLDYGGVGCIGCTKGSETPLIKSIQIPNDGISNGFGTLRTLGDPKLSSIGNNMAGNGVDNDKLIPLIRTTEANESKWFSQSQKVEPTASFGQFKGEVSMLPIREGPSFPNLTQQSVASSIFSKPDNSNPMLGLKDIYESVTQPSLSFSLSTSLHPPNSVLPFSGGVADGREHNKTPSNKQPHKTRHILPKPPKSSINIGLEANKTATQTRVARPPAEGRGRNQLLPRYWPRITDQELQQLSGDLNSTIVPLFEKVLSASDAGRIGRLVLPKACAEAYFPPISQSEGLPIKIQDIKGKEWTFQFRFWPNNNSRMYVLEGVTPCIQNMQLQAGDTVTFSRIDPGGKLVMGFRKAANSAEVQDNQAPAPRNGGLSGEASFSGLHENLLTPSLYWPNNEKNGAQTNEESLQQHVLAPEKKKTRNIGSKSKRLLMHSEDAMELRITWEEAQELLRPPPTARPTIVMIEDHEFEEYDEPPVFGKKTIFTARSSGEQEQWAQCDICSKWRRLPVDVLLPPKWMCSDNIWDLNRSSCSAPDDINPKELDSPFRVNKDFKKRRIAESTKLADEHEPSGLDALATAAVLGDNMGESGESSVGATTKHPRHRPGCTCIVCIQPPSGKGKHKPTCLCAVCSTVKRRFKTLMLRKKKRQSEREAEIEAHGKDMILPEDELDMDESSGYAALIHENHMENERSRCETETEAIESGKGQLDLNCHPNREDGMLAAAEATGAAGLTSLVHAANLPLDMYTGENSLATCLLSIAGGESEDQPPGEAYVAASMELEDDEGEQEQDNQSDEG